MNKKEIIKALKEILKKNEAHCLCGHGEWCEACSPDSRYWKLRVSIGALLIALKRGLNEKTRH